MLNCFVSFAAVVLLAFTIYLLTDVKPAITPLVSLTVLINIVCLAGMYDLLKPGVFIAYGIAAVAFGAGIIKSKNNIKEKINSFFKKSENNKKRRINVNSKIEM